MKCFVMLTELDRAYIGEYEGDDAHGVSISDVSRMEEGRDWEMVADLSVPKNEIEYWFKSNLEPLM